MHDVIEVFGSFMQHQDEGMEEHAESIASIAARGGHLLIHDVSEPEAFKQGCGDHQSASCGDFSIAFRGFVG